MRIGFVAPGKVLQPKAAMNRDSRIKAASRFVRFILSCFMSKSIVSHRKVKHFFHPNKTFLIFAASNFQPSYFIL